MSWAGEAEQTPKLLAPTFPTMIIAASTHKHVPTWTTLMESTDA